MEVSSIKRIVCLANSRMPGGNCIAGKELRDDGVPGFWVRPVSGRDDEGVAEEESRYLDGGTPHLLDVMEVPVLDAKPKGHQRENWLLDPNHRWAKVGSVDLARLPEWTDAVDTLWVNGWSTARGLNDRVGTSDAASLNTSLCLLKVNLTVSVFDYFGRRRVQGWFQHNGTDYGIWVTDPDYEDKYRQQPDGNYQVGECLATVSLSGVNRDGYSYKLIAAIIKP